MSDLNDYAAVVDIDRADRRHDLCPKEAPQLPSLPQADVRRMGQREYPFLLLRQGFPPATT